MCQAFDGERAFFGSSYERDVLDAQIGGLEDRVADLERTLRSVLTVAEARGLGSEFPDTIGTARDCLEAES